MVSVNVILAQRVIGVDPRAIRVVVERGVVGGAQLLAGGLEVVKFIVHENKIV